MTKLYELTIELNELHSMVMNGEATEEHLADTMEMIEGEFQEKAVNVGRFMLSLAPSVEAIDNEIKRLQARKKSIQSKESWLKDYLRSNMEAAEITVIEHDLFTIKKNKGRESVVVDDLDKLPDDYVTVKTDVAADKKAIMKAHKAGEEVPGARVVRGQSSIKIS